MKPGSQEIFTDAGNLANQGRYGDAGKLILARLDLSPSDVGRLDSKSKKLAYLAATYFVKGGEYGLGIELYIALGERHKAADLLEKNGDLIGAQKVREGRVERIDSLSVKPVAPVGGNAVSRYTGQRLEQEGKLDTAAKVYFQLKAFSDAARVLKKLGRIKEAANMYVEGGMAYEAAICYQELGDTGKSLENLVRVPRDHPAYRKAAVGAIQIAFQLNNLSFQLDNFLSEFIRTGATNERELDALYHLAKLYEAHDFLENAKEVLRKVASVNANYRNTDSRLERLERFSQPSQAVYEKIRSQEASFRGEQRRINPNAILSSVSDDPIPDLPPPPDLPGLTPPAQNVNGTMAQPSIPDSPTPIHKAPSNELGGTDRGFVVGNLIAGRYLLEAEIGRGGMAAVYQAEDQELEEKIALKVFLNQISDSAILAESQARFKQELKLSRKLIHKNIIRLYDIGIHYGHRYISMELLEGADLENHISCRQSPLDFGLGISLLVQACAGLQSAHDQGVVHRDIKPENLFVTNDGQLKVMDFGIAKNPVKAGMTIEGMVAGTPHYIAPEQISSFSKVTPLADLYSLGIVAYKMFTKRLPFDSDDLTALMMMHINDKPRSPRDFNDRIPKELEYVIMRLIEKNPTARFKSARELAGYLQEVYKRLKA